MADLATFKRNLDLAYSERFIARFVEYHKKVSLVVFQYLTTDAAIGNNYGSPVYSGRFLASHNIAINKIDTSVVAEHPEVASGQVSWPDAPSYTLQAKGMSTAARVLAALKPFDMVYASNNLPYARDLELGKSKFKAPFPIFLTVALKVAARFSNVRLK